MDSSTSTIPTSVREWASYYITRGWQVVPLAPNSKAATDDNWTRLIFKPEDFRDDDNIGLRSVNGLVVIDEDSAEAIQAADAFLPPTAAIWGRPSKPRAKRLYISTFQKTIAFKDLDPDCQQATLIELRVNHQDMAPSSKHPSGELLAWVECGQPAAVSSEDLLKAVRLVATTSLIARYYAPSGNRHDWALALAGTLRALGLTAEESIKVFSVAADIAGDTKPQDRLTEIRTTYARTDEEPIQGRRALNELTGSKHLSRSIQKIWGSSATTFIMDEKGSRVIANHQENVKRALNRLEIDLSYNVFSQKALVKYNGYTGPLQDDIRNRIWLEIDQKFNFRPNGDFFDVVLSDIAHQRELHPVREYLEKLKWDGVERLETWSIRHAKAADTAYVRAVSSLVLIAAVRRVMDPGCKFDELMVLESEQGQLKSSALRTLCPNSDWFSDDLPLNVDSKQIIERTLGKWIIEAAELSGMPKSQTEHLKSMLSRQVDGPVRLAYGRLPLERPRQFVVIGTTNSHIYLKDGTGNRRFWPIRVQKFNLEELYKEREQLWAEAYKREREGASIRLLPTLYEHAGMQQERRRATHFWEDHLAAHLSVDEKQRLTPDEVWQLLGIPIERRDERANEQLYNIMQRLGFRKISIARVINGQRRVISGWGREVGQLSLKTEEQ